MKNSAFSSLALLAAGSLLFTGCVSSSQAADGELQSITVGTSELGPVEDTIAQVAKEKGINVEWQSFSDWTLPNQALANGESDVNAFQHLAFLSVFNTAEQQDITPVGSTVITTMGLYSDKYDSVESLPQNATVAVSNNASHMARTLFMLEQAGLLKLAENVGVYPTTDDIIENPKNIVFKPIVAQQLVTVFKDVDAIVVGSTTIDQALSIPRDQALALDDANAESAWPYVNIVAVRCEDADSQLYKQFAQSWQDQRVKDAVEADSKGNTVVVDVPVEKLRTTLEKLEEVARGLEK